MALKYVDSFTKEQFKSFIDSFDTVVSDCDDVLWVGHNVLPGSVEVMNKFKELGKKICFVSNNSTLTRNALAKKLKSIGYRISSHFVLNCSYTAAQYTKDLGLPYGSKVYVVGNSGISQELDALGITHIGLGPDVLQTDVVTFASTLTLDPSVAVVLVGFDSDFSVPKLIKASSYLKNPNVHFIATNPDLRCNVNNIVIPGAGTIVHAVKTSSGREPIIMGKPDEYMRETVLQRWILTPERTLMIGDSCHTDILFGKLCGFQTLLVLSGVTKLPEVTRWKRENTEATRKLVPDYYITRLGDLMRWFI